VKAVQKIAILVPAVMLVFSPMVQARAHYSKAKVVNSAPIYQTVERVVPVEQCHVERVRSHQVQRSVTGPIVGALIGGALGNAVGHNKSNKRVGAVVGAVLGGSIGADISRRRHAERYRPVYRTEEVCRVVDEVYEERVLAGYNVTYRYAGETFTTRMDEDPGRYLRVRVSVTPV
jgi:uncharacterized protein YcfJ